MKRNLFIITEEEKVRILGMHKNATKSHYLYEQSAPAAGTQPAASVSPTAATATSTAGGSTTTPPSATDNKTTTQTGTTEEVKPQILYSNDKDYFYKKEGDKYFFKVQPKPVSPRAQQLQKAGKYVDWTEATGKALDAISKLNFKSETLATRKSEPISTTPTLATTQGSKEQVAAGGGGAKEIIDPIADAKKTLPNIDKVDPVKAREVIAWSKTPQGQYVLGMPVDQREGALDNLDRRKGDEQTRNLKKEIRQALGMAADTFAGRIGSAVKGGVQGARQGFRQQTT